MSPGAFARCEEILASAPGGKPFSPAIESEELFAHLIAGSFVIDEDFDELAFIVFG